MAKNVPDSRMPRRFSAVSTSTRIDGDDRLVAGRSAGIADAAFCDARGDRHRDGQHVVDEQRAGDRDAGVRAEVDGRHLVVAAAAGVGVHGLAVRRDHRSITTATAMPIFHDQTYADAPASDSMMKISSGA